MADDYFVESCDEHERPRDFLTRTEIDELLEASKKTRNPVRDYLLIFLMFRHALRVSEALMIRVENIDLDRASLWVNRLKNGLSTQHPLDGAELRAIRRWLRERKSDLPWLFVSSQGNQMSRSNVNHLLNRLKKKCRIDLEKIHPHNLRHSTGFHLANKGIDPRLLGDFMGHRTPQATNRYTRVAAKRFEKIWS